MTVLALSREIAVALPPIEPDRLCLVDGADDQAYTNRQELDFGERNLDVARHDQPFFEDAVQNIDKPARAIETEMRFRQTMFSIIPEKTGEAAVYGWTAGESKEKTTNRREKLFPACNYHTGPHTGPREKPAIHVDLRAATQGK